ncbi:hypothetical protein BDN67DRAFT_1018152 [Paxillus ammoniavirescens]|nr:hypothetical protein BDN67DRAFT_1018152 [Paxillus ammoniavirescens]
MFPISEGCGNISTQRGNISEVDWNGGSNVRTSEPSEWINSLRLNTDKLVRRIYRIGIPTEEVFLSIAMLNALSGKLSAVQTQVASLLSSSSKDRPFTSADICARLNTEQQLLDNEKARSADITLAASTHPKYGGHSHGGEKMCLLCVKRGHTVEGYPPTAVPSVGTSEFAGLAQDSTPAFLHTLPDGDQSEFDALMAHLGDLHVSVDWHRHSSPVDFANLSVAAPDQRTNTTIDPSVEPFFIDTGASVHISNTASDFYSLWPIPPRVVNGVGGSGICALGIGNI